MVSPIFNSLHKTFNPFIYRTVGHSSCCLQSVFVSKVTVAYYGCRMNLLFKPNWILLWFFASFHPTVILFLFLAFSAYPFSSVSLKLQDFDQSLNSLSASGYILHLIYARLMHLKRTDLRRAANNQTLKSCIPLSSSLSSWFLTPLRLLVLLPRRFWGLGLP